MSFFRNSSEKTLRLCVDLIQCLTVIFHFKYVFFGGKIASSLQKTYKRIERFIVIDIYIYQ